MQATLQTLTLTDVEAISHIARDSFSQIWSASDYRYFIVHSCGYCIGMREEGGPLKAYLLSLLIQGDLDIISIAVSTSARRQGLAEALLRSAQKDPRVHRILLEVDVENNAALKLYEKLGFAIQSVRKKYYEHSRDAYLMQWAP